MSACPQKVRLIWTKFGMCVEVSECYMTAWHMTQSKVKVMEVRNVRKCQISESDFLCQYSYNEKIDGESIFFQSAAEGIPARTVTLVVVYFLTWSDIYYQSVCSAALNWWICKKPHYNCCIGSWLRKQMNLNQQFVKRLGVLHLLSSMLWQSVVWLTSLVCRCCRSNGRQHDAVVCLWHGSPGSSQDQPGGGGRHRSGVVSFPWLETSADLCWLTLYYQCRANGHRSVQYRHTNTCIHGGPE